ncbi:MAG: hypothetical protein OEW35_13840 [Gammaproteobacteria bacterium]|nr:hypothetical protein [Gammaproteobacteria bacterium]MDH4255527.1 hypothetical protein [Gammaproteobacteria bacterium]MDH5311293.1 hypothetical protein [Gammaproteobacteria bacterium]
MNLQTWLDRIPLPLLYVLTIVLVLLAIGAGIRLGAHMKARSGEGESIGSVVGATLGLLAFMLAFTFNMTANRFDERKQLFLDEINAIGTVYLRAGLLAEPYTGKVRALLREYVDIRAQSLTGTTNIRNVIARSELIHDELWQAMEALATEQTPTIVHSLLIQSMNELIDLHGKRVIVGIHYRIPGTIWFGLYAIAVLGMIMVGYQFGQGRQRQYVAVFMLALAFSSVILLIADLDRAAEGTVRLNLAPLYELQQKLRADG